MQLTNRQTAANAVQAARRLGVTLYSERKNPKLDAWVKSDPKQPRNIVSIVFKTKLEKLLGKNLDNYLNLVVGNDIAHAIVAADNTDLGCDILLGVQGLRETPRPDTFTVIESV